VTRGDRLLLLATATPVFTVSGAATLWWLDRLTDPLAIVATLAVVAAADTLLAWIVERRAPTHVILHQGRSGPAEARVIGGFDAASPGRGKVISGNEIWEARCLDSQDDGLVHGTTVHVIGRENLVLLIKRSE